MTAALPKLIIKYFGQIGEDVCDLNEVPSIVNFNGVIVQAEGQQVRSYAELVDLANQDGFKNKPFITVLIVPAVVGG
jgi:hypothetical protein